MGSDYRDIDALCPFYQACEQSNKWSSICCEGIDMDEETRIKLQFKHKALRDGYKKNNCDADYHKCTIAKMLEQKYD